MGSCALVIGLTTVIIIAMVAALATPPLEDGGSCPPNPAGPNGTDTYGGVWQFMKPTKAQMMAQLAAVY